VKTSNRNSLHIPTHSALPTVNTESFRVLCRAI